MAQPSDATLRGKWWEIFGDPQLNALEEQVNVSNQNVAAAAASFLAARALVKQARAQYYPTVGGEPEHHEFAAVARPIRRNRRQAVRRLVRRFSLVVHGLFAAV